MRRSLTSQYFSSNKIHRERTLNRRKNIGHKQGGFLWCQVGTLTGLHGPTGNITITYTAAGLRAIQAWVANHSEANFWIEDELVSTPVVGTHLRGARGTTAASHANGTPVFLEGLKLLDPIDSAPVVPAFSNDSSFDFDGSGDAIVIGDRPEFDGATALTIQGWLRAATGTGYRSIVSKFNFGSQNCFELAKVGVTQTLRWYISSVINQANHFVTSTAVIPADGNTWLHFVAVFDGSLTGNTNRARLYFDSVLDTPSADGGTIPAALLATTTDLRIGLYDPSSAASCWDGEMDEIAIWVNHAASQAQVTELFNGGEPGDLADYSGGLPDFWYRADGDTLPTVIDHGAVGADGTATAGVTISAVVP